MKAFEQWMLELLERARGAHDRLAQRVTFETSFAHDLIGIDASIVVVVPFENFLEDDALFDVDAGERRTLVDLGEQAQHRFEGFDGYTDRDGATIDVRGRGQISAEAFEGFALRVR